MLTLWRSALVCVLFDAIIGVEADLACLWNVRSPGKGRVAAAVAAAAAASATAGAIAAHSVNDRSADQPATVADPTTQNNHLAAADGDGDGEEGSEGEDGEDGAGIVVPESALEQVPSTALSQPPAPSSPRLGSLPPGGGPISVLPQLDSRCARSPVHLEVAPCCSAWP